MTVATFKLDGEKYATYYGVEEIKFDKKLHKYVLESSDGAYKTDEVKCSAMEVRLLVEI